MIRPHKDEPCWEIVYVSTGKPPEYESDRGWPHYGNEAAALAELPATQQDYDDPLTVRQSFGQPCVGFFCDGCGAELELNEWTHLDPDDPDPAGTDWRDIDVIAFEGQHWCAGFRSCLPANLCPGGDSGSGYQHEYVGGICVECDREAT